MKSIKLFEQFVNEKSDFPVYHNLYSSAINAVEAVKDANDLYFRKGQMSIIASIVNLEAQIDVAEESVLADELLDVEGAPA